MTYFIVRHSADRFILLRDESAEEIAQFMHTWYACDGTVVFETEDRSEAQQHLAKCRRLADYNRRYVSVTRQIDPFKLAAPVKEFDIPF